MPLSASNEEIREEVWYALGHRLHVGIRGQLGDLEYFRNLTRSVLPLLLPPGLAESRYMLCVPALKYCITRSLFSSIQSSKFIFGGITCY